MLGRMEPEWSSLILDVDMVVWQVSKSLLWYLCIWSHQWRKVFGLIAMFCLLHYHWALLTRIVQKLLMWIQITSTAFFYTFGTSQHTKLIMSEWAVKSIAYSVCPPLCIPCTSNYEKLGTAVFVNQLRWWCMTIKIFLLLFPVNVDDDIIMCYFSHTFINVSKHSDARAGD